MIVTDSSTVAAGFIFVSSATSLTSKELFHDIIVYVFLLGNVTKI